MSKPTLLAKRQAEVALARYKRNHVLHGFTEPEEILTRLYSEAERQRNHLRQLESDREEYTKKLRSIGHVLNRPVIERAIYDMSGPPGQIAREEFFQRETFHNREWVIPLRFREAVAREYGEQQMLEALTNVLRHEVRRFYTETP